MDARAGPDVYNPDPIRSEPPRTETPMHYDAHQPVIDDLEARITTIRDSL